MRKATLIEVVVVAAFSAPLAAQPPVPSVPLVATSPASDLRLLPALTPVALILDATISSNKNHRGDRFALHVADDVVVGGVVVIGAGSVGEGEVVHADRSRAGGKAGELILAARYVTVAGRRVRLRSFTAGEGRDRTKAALGVGVVAGPAAFLVRGGAFVIPSGTPASAKTSEDIQLPAAGSGKNQQP